MGPRFSGKVREERQCRDWKVGEPKPRLPTIPKPRTSEPAIETVEETERLSPYSFQPSRDERWDLKR